MRLKLAIIGCGRISAVYKEAFKDLADDVSVVCAIDKIKSRAVDFASAFPGCQAGDSLEDIYAYEPDVLHICLPHYLHSSVAIDAMKRGINILVEKPVAMNCTEADEMIATRDEMNVLASCIFQTRYIEAVSQIRKAIKSGELGDIIGVKSSLAWTRPADYYEGSDWKGTWSGEGGGVLIDQAIHSIDRVRYILDKEIKSVEGSISNFAHDYLDVEDTSTALVEFDGGIIYNIYATNAYVVNDPITIDFIGTKGRAGLIQDFGYIEENGKRREIRESYEGKVVGENYWGSSHNVQIKLFYEAVRAKKSGEKIEDIGVSLEDAKKTLELVRAIYKSAREGEKIDFPYAE